MTEHSFHMKNDLNDVDRTVLALKAQVEKSLSPSAQFKLEVSVSEALSNVVKHAINSNLSQSIALNLSETATSIRVEIYDPIGAKTFDLRDHAQPLNAVDPLAKNGRGLGLIILCSDHVDYGAKDGRMCLSLSFLKSGDRSNDLT